MYYLAAVVVHPTPSHYPSEAPPTFTPTTSHVPPEAPPTPLPTPSHHLYATPSPAAPVSPLAEDGTVPVKADMVRTMTASGESNNYDV